MPLVGHRLPVMMIAAEDGASPKSAWLPTD
jgi:hypothetical protein